MDLALRLLSVAGFNAIINGPRYALSISLKLNDFPLLLAAYLSTGRLNKKVDYLLGKHIILYYIRIRNGIYNKGSCLGLLLNRVC